MKAILHGIGAYEGGATIGPAKWSHHDLIVTIEGTVDFEMEGRKFSCTAGDAILVPPYSRFHGTAGPEGGRIWVQHFHWDKRRAFYAMFLPSWPIRWPNVATREWPRILMRQIAKLQGATLTRGTRRILSLQLTLLLEEFQALAKGKIAPDPRRAVEKIQATVAWIEKHPHPLPPLEEMAKLAGWSLSHFRDQFRSLYGRPVGTFLKELRMNEAERLLLESTSPIKAIATQLGYSDVVAFHRAFLHHSQTTPREFRRRAPLVF